MDPKSGGLSPLVFRTGDRRVLRYSTDVGDTQSVLDPRGDVHHDVYVRSLVLSPLLHPENVSSRDSINFYNYWPKGWLSDALYPVCRIGAGVALLFLLVVIAKRWTHLPSTGLYDYPRTQYIGSQPSQGPRSYREYREKPPGPHRKPPRLPVVRVLEFGWVPVNCSQIVHCKNNNKRGFPTPTFRRSRHRDPSRRVCVIECTGVTSRPRLPVARPTIGPRPKY